MKPQPLKPKKAEAWQCPVCGRAYEIEGHCRLCIRNHIPGKDIRIKQAIPAEDTSLLYKEGDRWPFLLEMWCPQTGNYVLYQRVPDKHRPKMRGSTKRPGPVLG